MESMVAIIIVMIVFSLTSIIILNSSTSGMTREKQNAYMAAKLIRNQTLHEHRFIDETIEVNGLFVEKSILDYRTSNQLKILRIEVFQNKQKLYESKELILNSVAL